MTEEKFDVAGDRSIEFDAPYLTSENRVVLKKRWHTNFGKKKRELLGHTGAGERYPVFLGSQQHGFSCAAPCRRTPREQVAWRLKRSRSSRRVARCEGAENIKYSGRQRLKPDSSILGQQIILAGGGAKAALAASGLTGMFTI